MLTLVSTDPIQQDENGVYFVRAYFTNSNGDELNTGLPVSGASATQDYNWSATIFGFEMVLKDIYNKKKAEYEIKKALKDFWE